MDPRTAIKLSLDMSKFVVDGYLEDLTDDELMKRPHPDCNHVKWQLGHLIASENQIGENAVPGSMPALPEGFSDRYSKETASSDDPAAFDSKSELLRLAAQQREATLAALAALADDDFDKPTPESMQAYAPTVAAAFSMQGSHWMMHAGQWAVVRRQLGRPPLF